MNMAMNNITLTNMVEKLHQEQNWLCVISSDEGNQGVNINDECGTMMNRGGRRFFVFNVSKESCYTWMSVAGALEERSKVFVLHMGMGDPPFSECSDLTCIHPVPQEMSYKEHVHNTFKEMKVMFNEITV